MENMAPQSTENTVDIVENPYLRFPAEDAFEAIVFDITSDLDIDPKLMKFAGEIFTKLESEGKNIEDLVSGNPLKQRLFSEYSKATFWNKENDSKIDIAEALAAEYGKTIIEELDNRIDSDLYNTAQDKIKLNALKTEISTKVDQSSAKLETSGYNKSKTIDSIISRLETLTEEELEKLDDAQIKSVNAFLGALDLGDTERARKELDKLEGTSVYFKLAKALEEKKKELATEDKDSQIAA